MKLAVPVLAYRNVSPVSGVSPNEFSLQLGALAHAGWRSVSVSELVDALKNGAPLRENPYLVTFDDAYLDNWVYAMPVLRRHGIRAAFGCVTAYLHDAPPRPTAGEGAPALHDLPTARDAWDLALEDDDYSAFMSRAELRALVRGEGHELLGHTHTRQLCFTSNRPQPLDATRSSDAFGAGLHGIFLETGDGSAGLPSGSAYACNGFWPSGDDPLTATLLERTTAERIDFCTQEFALCRQRLEDLAGTPSRAMVWPCGQYDDVAIQAASLAGYEAAFSSDPGANGAKTPLFALRRLAVEGGTSSAELLRRMTRAVQAVQHPFLERFFR